MSFEGIAKVILTFYPDSSSGGVGGQTSDVVWTEDGSEVIVLQILYRLMLNQVYSQLV